MGTTKTAGGDSDKTLYKIKEQTSMAILSKDLTSTMVLFESDVEKELASRIIKVINNSYLERERDIMTKFAFDFYADLSRRMNVPENLISENLTHAEIYFEEKFNGSQV